MSRQGDLPHCIQNAFRKVDWTDRLSGTVFSVAPKGTGNFRMGNTEARKQNTLFGF